MDQEKFEKSKPPTYDGNVNVHSGFDKLTGQKVDLSQAERDALYGEAVADDKAAVALQLQKEEAVRLLDEAQVMTDRALVAARNAGLIQDSDMPAETVDPDPRLDTLPEPEEPESA